MQVRAFERYIYLCNSIENCTTYITDYPETLFIFLSCNSTGVWPTFCIVYSATLILFTFLRHDLSYIVGKPLPRRIIRTTKCAQSTSVTIIRYVESSIYPIIQDYKWPL